MSRRAGIIILSMTPIETQLHGKTASRTHHYESADDRDMREVGRRSKGRCKRAEAFGAT